MTYGILAVGRQNQVEVGSQDVRFPPTLPRAVCERPRGVMDMERNPNALRMDGGIAGDG